MLEVAPKLYRRRGAKMKPDLTYTARLLAAFEAAEKPHVDLRELNAIDASIVPNDQYIFHLRLLADQGLVEGAEDSGALGIHFSRRDVSVVASSPLRLTARGHDFASNLRERHNGQSVAEAILAKAGESGLAVWVQIAATVAAQWALMKLGVPG